MKKTFGLRDKLLVFGSVFLIFYAIFIIFHLIVRHMGASYPEGEFLFFPVDRFKDFTNINQAISEMDPYRTQMSNYPPFILLIASIFSSFGDYSGYNVNTLRLAINDDTIWLTFVVFVVMYAAAFMTISIAYFRRRSGLKKASDNWLMGILVGMILLFSAPSIFAVDRGNYILFAIIFFMLWAILEYEKEDSCAGAVFAGLCAGVKIYPIYVCMMYFFERKWKKLAVSAGTFVASVLIPVLFFKGNYFENLREFYKGAMGFGDGNSFYFLYFNVGFTGMAGYMFRMLGLHPLTDIIHCAWLCFGIASTLLAGFLIHDEKAAWKKILVVSALMVYLTPNAYLYCSAFMLGPILVMLVAHDSFTKRDIPYLVMSALLLVPKAYYYLPDMTQVGIPLEYNTLNCAVLLDGLLYFAIIVYYLTEKIAVDVATHKKTRTGNEVKTVGEQGS